MQPISIHCMVFANFSIEPCSSYAFSIPVADNDINIDNRGIFHTSSNIQPVIEMVPSCQ